VSVSRVEETFLPDRVEAAGSLSYKEKVELRSPLGARVERILAREGDRVAAGQALVLLSNPQVEYGARSAGSAVDSARAELELATARYRQARMAAEGKFVSLERSRLAIEIERRTIAEAERKLCDTRKLAAVDGVSAEEIKTGEFSLGQERDKLELMLMDYEVDAVGYRDADLKSFGLAADGAGALGPDAMRAALVDANTLTLKAERDAAAAKLEAARRELDAANNLAAELRVLAPRAATVGAVGAEEGERVEAGAGLLTLMDVSRLCAMLPVRESEALKLASGQAAEIRIDSLGSEPLKAFVDLVPPFADSRSGAFMVKVSLAGQPGKARPGMFARAVITCGPGRKAILLPAHSILRSAAGEGRAVAVVNRRACLKSLKLGAEGEGGVEVLRGLSAGDIVMDYPDPTLSEGEEVVPR
jgi:RND family efflux transporter MFP subunit